MGRRPRLDPRLRSRTMRNLIGVVVIVWLVIGVLAAFQRGYITDKKDVSCRSFGEACQRVDCISFGASRAE